MAAFLFLALALNGDISMTVDSWAEEKLTQIEVLKDWKKVEKWQKEGTHFLVEVMHFVVDYTSLLQENAGCHRWCVYVYIYPQHPLFYEFDSSNNFFQPAASKIPFHVTATFLKHHTNFQDIGIVTSIQVGADYNHLGDERFTHMSTPEEAINVFQDAENLYDWFQQYTGENQDASS